jgi:hypothetical protein
MGLDICSVCRAVGHDAGTVKLSEFPISVINFQSMSSDFTTGNLICDVMKTNS